MGYDNSNLLSKIAKIQSIVLENKKKGLSQKWIYENQIKDQFYISYSSFNRYLGINAKAELKEKGH
ncbi:hypothetical protein [Parabacteroides faecis]|uniref:hypothetical protein n=1 Tax=Parabacteroides faecis TaxID=1217282 RepID=UPI003522821F